jgi:YD repeat-containing protein
LGAFTNEVQAQRGKKITKPAADDLIAQAQFIIAVLSSAPTPELTLTPTQMNTETPLPTLTPTDIPAFTPTFTEIPLPTFTLTPSFTPTETFTPLPTATEIPLVIPLTIDFTYDALHRLKSAVYSDGKNFSYTYDVNGNTVETKELVTVTAYTYDAANQLVTAQSEDTTWNYVYDGNGSLIKVLPNGSETSGAKRYSYNAAGYLVKVEAHDGSAWNIQAEMSYDGLGTRLSTSASGVETTYASDGQAPLITSSGDKSTIALYGLGPVAEKTDTWNYALSDGLNVPRQLTDANGATTLSILYNPWGDPVEINGIGNFDSSYIGILTDAATGLIYVGNGQYYDPKTGRFLTRGVNPNSPNPYVPWNPIGGIVAPFALASMYHSYNKKKKKNRVIWLVLLALTLATLACAMPCSCTGTCSQTNPTPTDTPPTTNTPTPAPSPTATSTPPPPTETPTPTPPCPIPVPGGISGQFTITHYTIPQESDPYFHRYGGSDDKGGGNIAITADNGATWKYQFIAVLNFAVGNFDGDNWSVLVNGSGYFNDSNEHNYQGKYLHVAVAGYSTTSSPYNLFEILDEKPKPCGGSVLKPLEAQEVTIAVNETFLNTGQYTCGQKFTIDLYPGKIFIIGDAGTFKDPVTKQPDYDHFDIYVGQMHKRDFDVSYPHPLSGYVQQVQ